MREPPAALPEDTLLACLRANYGLDIAELIFLPLGYDASAWVYRARTAGNTNYFLKVRTGIVNEPGLLVPRYLHEQGIARVVAPLPTATGTLWTAAGGYAMILYPYVDGGSGMARGLSDQQWIEYGALLRRIHGTALPHDLAADMRRETFVPVGAAMIRNLEARIHGEAPAGRAAEALTAFWQQQRETIHTLMARAEELGRRLAQRAPAFVLCHADIHTSNLMLDDFGQVWIVDWDETVLAPRERDLMFALGGGISRTLVRPRDEELFLQGYGQTALDSLALSYYRYAWAVSDIGAYGEEVLFRPDLGPISKRAALDGFTSLFLPGNIVSLALASDIGAA